MTQRQTSTLARCVSGDTAITTESVAAKSGRTVRRTRIADLYERWHIGFTDSMGRVRRLPSVRAQHARVLNEETLLFERAPIVDVLRGDVQNVLTFRAETGQELSCTADHALFTNQGWVKACDLGPGHLLVVTGKRSAYAGRQIPPALRAGIGVWTSMQRSTAIKPVDACYLCGTARPRAELVLDHVVPVAADLLKALDVRNLRPTCEPCHRAKTDSEQHLARRNVTAGAKFVQYERVEEPRETQTYDLVVAGPWHNYLANGVVVHNSGKGRSPRRNGETGPSRSSASGQTLRHPGIQAPSSTT
ncbi:HNH endonuclease [Streptomyces sp. NPDC056600]|uniref:HNH endonuclease n=1 Tax=Streptomyces sp. NPDC056600 TaxID=3345874 RepID=UPI003673B741